MSVHVLGPPTIEQHAEVASERASDPSEFRMLYRQLVGQLPSATIEALSEAGKDDASIMDVAEGPGAIGPVKWITTHLDRQQLASFADRPRDG